MDKTTLDESFSMIKYRAQFKFKFNNFGRINFKL